MATIPITMRVRGAANGSPTVSWMLPDDPDGNARTTCWYQVGAYREGDQDPNASLSQAAPPPFRFVPVAATGWPALAYGAVPDPILVGPLPPSFTFTGSRPSNGILPNGTYIIWLHVIVRDFNDANEVINEDSGVAFMRNVRVTSSVGEARPRIIRAAGRHGARVSPDPPIIVTPVAAVPPTTVQGSQLGAAIRVPDGVVPSHFQVAVYRGEDYDIGLRRANRSPIARSVNIGSTRASAEKVPSYEFPYDRTTETWTLNFGTGEVPELAPGIPNSPPGKDWVLVVRYSWEDAGIITDYNPRTGLVREEHIHLTSHSAYRFFRVTGSFPWDGVIPDDYIYVPTVGPGIQWDTGTLRGEVGSSLRLDWHYQHRRGIGQRYVQIRRDLAGASNAGTRYLKRVGRVLSWVTALDTTADATTDLVQDADHIVLPPGTAVGTGWGGLTWGVHSFTIRAVSGDGEISPWSLPLLVSVYRQLSITSLSVPNVTNGFITATWAHDGATGNNRQTRYRVQVFDDRGRFVTGTSDRPSDPSHARALPGDALTWTANRAAGSLGPVKNGTYNVVVTLWDIGGNETQRSASVTVTNTAPPSAATTITPRIYDHQHRIVNDPATGMPATSGLHPGEYVGVGFGTVTGLWGVRLERVEFSRRDGRLRDDEPQQIGLLPLGTATALERFNDYEVDDGVEYNYRATAISLQGAETVGSWTPDPAAT